MNAKRQAAIAKIEPITEQEILASYKRNVATVEARMAALNTEQDRQSAELSELLRLYNALHRRLQALEREADARRKA